MWQFLKGKHGKNKKTTTKMYSGNVGGGKEKENRTNNNINI